MAITEDTLTEVTGTKSTLTLGASTQLVVNNNLSHQLHWRLKDGTGKGGVIKGYDSGIFNYDIELWSETDDIHPIYVLRG